MKVCSDTTLSISSPEPTKSMLSQTRLLTATCSTLTRPATRHMTGEERRREEKRLLKHVVAPEILCAVSYYLKRRISSSPYLYTNEITVTAPGRTPTPLVLLSFIIDALLASDFNDIMPFEDDATVANVMVSAPSIPCRALQQTLIAPTQEESGALLLHLAGGCASFLSRIVGWRAPNVKPSHAATASHLNPQSLNANKQLQDTLRDTPAAPLPTLPVGIQILITDVLLASEFEKVRAHGSLFTAIKIVTLKTT